MSDFTPDPHDLEVLTQVLQRVACVHRLPAAEAEDFAQSVRLRLVQRDYDILRRFNGRSSLRTYLSVVVVRLLIDWRNAQWGKWRPSVAAQRLGDHAVVLERLMYRDGQTSEEAVETAAKQPGAPAIAELRQLAQRLPPRLTRRRMLNHDLGRTVAVPFADPIEAAEQASAERRVTAQLASALDGLPREERKLLYLRYICDHSVIEIARALRMDPKRLYRRFDASLRRLRVELAARGITRTAP